MSDLATFAQHARTMATADHKPECPWSNPAEARRQSGRPVWRAVYGTGDSIPDALAWVGTTALIDACPGCVTGTERAIWRQIADEADAHLSDDDEEGLFE